MEYDKTGVQIKSVLTQIFFNSPGKEIELLMIFFSLNLDGLDINLRFRTPVLVSGFITDIL